MRYNVRIEPGPTPAMKKLQTKQVQQQRGVDVLRKELWSLQLSPLFLAVTKNGQKASHEEQPSRLWPAGCARQKYRYLVPTSPLFVPDDVFSSLKLGRGAGGFTRKL